MSDTPSHHQKSTIDQLIRRSWNLRNRSDFNKFFAAIAKFEHYSRYNTMLVYLQNREVTFFGGESYWKNKFDRTIRPDARPYIILAPMSPVMLVYDIMDTVGTESPPRMLDRIFGEYSFSVKGYLDPEVLQKTIKITRNWGISVTYKPMSYFKAGYVTIGTNNRLEIFLKEGRPANENFVVLLHELAHVFLGHLLFKELSNKSGKKRMKLPENRGLTRNQQELEAETVSYLISTKLGLLPRSEDYLAGYIKDIKDLEYFSFETVIKVTDRMESIFLPKSERETKIY